jgi:hypothetical protein
MGHSLVKYSDKVRGKEQKISESGGLIPILQNAALSPIEGLQAIPPLTTEAEAMRLVQLYVQGVRLENPKVAAQLRASSPRILDLVYVPCIIHVSPPIAWLGSLSPSTVGDPQVLLGFIS